MTAEFGPQIAEVGEVVRLAVAPVFLLSSVGVTLTLLALIVETVKPTLAPSSLS